MEIIPESDVPQVLSGWKDIAKYLGKGVRTVQRYEWELGLPVRRPAGKLRGSVVATRAELDAWVAGSPLRNSFQTNDHPNDPAYSAETTAIRIAVAEMHALRARTKELRRQVMVAVANFRADVQSLTKEFEYDPRTELDWTFSLVERGFGVAPVLGLLDNRRQRPRAS